MVEPSANHAILATIWRVLTVSRTPVLARMEMSPIFVPLITKNHVTSVTASSILTMAPAFQTFANVRMVLLYQVHLAMPTALLNASPVIRSTMQMKILLAKRTFALVRTEVPWLIAPVLLILLINVVLATSSTI